MCYVCVCVCLCAAAVSVCVCVYVLCVGRVIADLTLLCSPSSVGTKRSLTLTNLQEEQQSHGCT